MPPSLDVIPTPTDAGPAGCADLLVRLAAGRDAEAWADLLRQIGPDIARVAQRVLRDASLTDDAVQETLLRIRDHAEQFSPLPRCHCDRDCAARGWILRVATTTSLNLLRQRQRQRVRTNDRIDHQHDHRDEGPTRRIEHDETSTIVRRQVAGLSELNREAVTLHFFGGLSFDSLARELGVPIDTAKRRVHRGLYALRQRLELAGCALLLVALAGLPTRATAAESGDAGPALRWGATPALSCTIVEDRTPVLETVATNRPPVLAKPIPDQSVRAGEMFTYTIPDATFVDPDGDHLIWEVDGLPSWLDLSGQTIYGVCPTGDHTAAARLTVTVTDAGADTASDGFSIIVLPKAGGGGMAAGNGGGGASGCGIGGSLSVLGAGLACALRLRRGARKQDAGG